MEAGAAAGAQAPAVGADAPAGGDPAAAGADPAAQAPAGPDYEAMQAQLSELGPSLDEIRSSLAALQPTPAAGADGQQTAEQQQAQQPDLSYLDPSSADYDPRQAGEKMLAIIAQQNKTAIQEAVAPLQSELSQTRQQLAAQELVAEFPDLADEKVAQQVLTASRQWVAAAGLPESAAQNPQVWRSVYLMSVAAELQAKEKDNPAAAAATLEGAGGASPAGASSAGGARTADDILGSQRGRSVLPFS